MESNDARILRGAAIPGPHDERRGRPCEESASDLVFAYGELLLPVPVQPESACEDSDALIAAPAAAAGAVTLRPSRGDRSRGLWHG
jgi:hypothetical protein